MRAPRESAERRAREIATWIKEQMPDGWGFILMLASFGQAGGLTYLSTMNREDAIRVLQEWIARQKGQPTTQEFVDGTSLECWCCGSRENLTTLRGPLRSLDVCMKCRQQ